MPLHLQPLDLSDKLRNYRSILIVSCPICPPVSIATDSGSPFMELVKHGIKTPAYEHHLGEIRESLERDGIKTGVFTSYLPCAATCLWTRGQRKRLLRRARDYDAALVMGCESARCTVQETLKDTNCDVILAMRLVGITNAKLTVEFPLTVRLDHPMRVTANEQVEQGSQAGV